MSEFPAPAGGTSATLRRSVRRQLEQMQPPLRTFAENILAEGSRIDLVTRDPLGAVVVVLIADPGEDLAVFTRALAHLNWVQQRIPDWLQFAPELDLSSTVHALLLCPEFRPETIAAAHAIAPLVRLSRYRDLQQVSGHLLLEPVRGSSEPETRLHTAPPPAADTAASAASGQPEPPPRPSEFRSGLSEFDLKITPAERSEFG